MHCVTQASIKARGYGNRIGNHGGIINVLITRRKVNIYLRRARFYYLLLICAAPLFIYFYLFAPRPLFYIIYMPV
jgi:hypothetical protein